MKKTMKLRIKIRFGRLKYLKSDWELLINMLKLIIVSIIFAAVSTLQLSSDYVLSNQACMSFQIGHDYIEKSFTKMVDQYIARYMKMPKYSHDSIIKNTIDNVSFGPYRMLI